MKKALVLHAWYNSPNDHWYPWVKKILEEKKYYVFVPELPSMNTDLPDMELQLKTIQDLVEIDKDTIIISHSLSCLLAMRLAERKSYKKMILVAGWDINDLTPQHRLFWTTSINHAKIKENVKEIYCFSSDNDPYFTLYQNEEMCKRLGGKFSLVKNAGHFTTKDGITKIPQMLKYL
jgi:uncharacterized protein